MTNKTPPSLNWLIDKRARIAGDIIKLQKKLKRVKVLIDKLHTLEKDLSVIDHSLSLHEIKIDFNLIEPIRGSKRPIRFLDGTMEDNILRFLKTKPLRVPIKKAEIIDFITAQYQLKNPEILPLGQVSIAVKNSLHRCLRKGFVNRHHDIDNNNIDGEWSLSEKFISTHSLR